MQAQPVDTRDIEARAIASELLANLQNKSKKVTDKYDYYNADATVNDYGISIPKKMVNKTPGVGWASRAVNTLSDRVVFEGFGGDTFGINDYFESIQAAKVINDAKHDAYIAGCSFIAVADDPNSDSDRKVLIPFTALEATGDIDYNTGLLKRGVAVTRWGYPEDNRRKKVVQPKDFIVFTPEYTATYINSTLYDIAENPTKRCLLHPITYRSSADRPFGKARITNTVRRIIQEVSRVKRRYEIAGEFYSTPQRYINGLAEGAKKDPKMDSAIGKVWTITKDEDGDMPQVGQLAQMTINQFSDNKKDLARDFCAETALTLRNLGYETGNPAGADSLKAMSDDLLLDAQASQIEIGNQIREIAITLRLALNQDSNVPDQLLGISPAWQPIFQIDIGKAGDAMFKLFDVMPELKGTVTGYRMLGIGIREAEELAQKRQQLQASAFMNGGTQ